MAVQQKQHARLQLKLNKLQKISHRTLFEDKRERRHLVVAGENSLYLLLGRHDGP